VAKEVRSVALATPHYLATAAGRAAVAAGGNAVDAALAAAAVLAVIHPQDTAIGGDAVAIVHPPDGRPSAYIGVGRTAAGLDVAGVRRRAGDAAIMQTRGCDPITVPGVVGLWGILHEAFAVRPWALALRRAIGLAGEGVAVSGPLARAIADEGELIRSDPGLTAALTPDGRALRQGDILRQPALAGTLHRIAEAGPGDFYRGETAAALVTGLQRRGSELDIDDFADHRTLVTRPLVAEWGRSRLWVAPPPTQGYALLQVLAAVELLGLQDPLGADSSRLAQVLAEVSAQRDRWLADATSDQQPWTLPGVTDLVSGLGSAAPTMGVRAAGDTVAIVAVDSAGLAVSLIQSVFFAFGAGVLDPVTGVLFHNRGASFVLEPGHRAELVGGRRPPHTLLPVVGSGPEGITALGTMGGLAQPQILAQVLLRLRSGATPQEAVTAPRWTLGSIERGGPALQIESGVAATASLSLARLGWQSVELDAVSDAVGHAQVARRSPTGALSVGTDPRAAGRSA
jgi:gamma-glutamyltranspeptidase